MQRSSRSQSYETLCGNPLVSSELSTNSGRPVRPPVSAFQIGIDRHEQERPIRHRGMQRRVDRSRTIRIFFSSFSTSQRKHLLLVRSMFLLGPLIWIVPYGGRPLKSFPSCPLLCVKNEDATPLFSAP